MVSRSPVRIIYFGTPAYAVPALRSLNNSREFDVALVVTQPDRQGGRGHKLIAPPVKDAARDLGLPLIQPPTLKDEAVRTQLRQVEADLFVVAAYGRIFSQAVLDIPARGCLNLHASILPAYRGAAPIPAAILNGDTDTGVTLMVMERGLDTGPILDVRRTQISPTDTTESLTNRLADLGAELVVASIPGYLSGELPAQAQPTGATAVRLLAKADGQIDWAKSAAQIERQVRAMWPWPRAYTLIGERTLQIHQAEIGPDLAGATPGSIHGEGGLPLIATGGGGSIAVLLGQVAGSRPAGGHDLLRGRVLRPGDRCVVEEVTIPALITEVDTPATGVEG